MGFTIKRTLGGAFCCVVTFFFFFSPRPATASISVQTLRPSTNTTYTIVEDAFFEQVPRASKWTGKRLLLSAQYNIVNDPLIEYDQNHVQQTAVLVDSVNTLDLTAGIFLAQDLEVALIMPLNLSHFAARSTDMGTGDFRIQGKYRIPWQKEEMALSVIPELLLPAGSRDLLLSNGSWGVGVMFAFETDISRLRFAANIGYRHMPNATFREIDYRNLMPLALGFHLPINEKWGANMEIARALTIPGNSYNNPSDFYLGGRYQMASDIALASGFSFPTLGSGGSGDFRFVVNAKFSPEFNKFFMW